MRKLYRIIGTLFKKKFTQPIPRLILLGCLFGSNAHAQPFPVSVNTQLSSPSLPYLADYVREKPESLRVLLLLNDDRRTNYEVLLKIRISGQGIELASRPDYFSAPVNLLFNVPELLTGFELADLFDPNNLDISGMAKSEFLKTGQLPEGIYTICFEAYDVNRFDELPVSNGGCAVASVIEHEPPYLIQPTGITPFTEPTILPFNWHPGHTNSFRTEYRLYLYEAIPGWTHDQIILSQAPLYTVETNTTTYPYSAIDPFLEKGATYLWRVQAYDPDGFELFKNNGFSQLAQFTYGQNCDAPLGLQALTVHSNTQLIRWVDNNPGTYELRYRPEVVPLNSNPDTVNPTTTTVSGPPPSGIGLVNPKGKDKNGNSPIVTTAPTTTGTPANAAPFVNPDNIAWNFWATISDIKQPEYLLNNLISSRYQIQVRRICGPGNISPWSAALTIDNRQPESPEFLLPPKATEPTEITETLFTANWEYQTEAYFELQIARDTGFAILVPGYENLTVTDLQQPITGLAGGQTYFYRVKALRGDLESAYSNVQLVQTVSTDPYNLPSLLALPAQPTTYDGFTAHWTGTTPFLLYHLEVARDREFTQPLPGYENGSQPITSGINELPVSVGLLTQGVFYRIRSAGIGGVGYSNIIEVPRQYLPIPVALEPTEITDQGFTAHWEALPEATEYIIDVATSAEFNELVPELSNQTVSGTSIVFSEYLDPENTTYFYQVRAKINDRTSGNSNPIVVNEGGLAVVPVALPATQIKKTSFWANWENLAGINTYTLDVATQPDFEPRSFVDGFENKTVYGNTCKITSVDFSGTNYYYRIRAVENDQYSIYSNAQNVEWKGCYFGPMAMDYSCGIPADPYFNEGLPMIAELEKGDTIQAGDFLVILNEVTGSSPFSGKGYVAMPFQQVRLNLEFSNIKVDETCRMVDGRMEVTGAGLALISEEIADQINDILEVLDEIDQTLESVENVLEEISDVLTATESVGGYFTNGIHLIEGTDPIFSEYPYLPPGATDSLQGAIDCFLTTFSPDCKDDLVNGLQILQDNLADHFNSSQQIIFQASSDQIYGFDSIVHPAFSEHYQGITVAGKPYQISWKSVENGQTDVVEARTGNGQPFPANIRFEDTEKNEIPTVMDGNIARLTITGAGDQSVYPIYAVEVGDTVKLAGKLNMVSYNPKPVQLVVVPVNGVAYPFSSDNLATQLQTIFQPALVDLSVRIAPNFTVADFDNELDAISTGFAQSYTQEMKDLFRAYEDANALDEDAYYIFLLPRFADTDQLGYMPRKRSFGFVNHEQLQSQENQYVKTLAHELAHGAFVLHHTFEQHPQLEGNPTENLLDYSPAGTITHQYQWVAMHDPSRAWTLFDEDEERGHTVVNVISLLNDYKNQNGTFTFVAPSGKPITIPANTTAVSFNTGDEIKVGNECFTGFGIYPFGTLRYFISEGRTYSTAIGCSEQGDFSFYKEYNGSKVYVDTFTNDLNLNTQQAIIGFPCYSESRLIFKVGQISIKNDLNITSVLSTNYKGRGQRKPFDFLANFSVNCTKEIYGNSYPEYSEEAHNLLSIIGEAASCNSNLVFYAFTHAHQISSYPGFFEVCGENFSDLTLEKTRLIAEERYKQLRNLSSIQHSGGTSTLYEVTQEEVFTETEIRLWKEKDKSVYQRYYEVKNDTWATQLLGFDENPTDAAELLALLQRWEKDRCVFKDFTLPQRIKALKVLSHGGASWWKNFNNEEEDVYNYILRTTPDVEIDSILQIFEADSFALFKRVANKMENSWLHFNDKTGLEPFMGHLSHMVLKKRFQTGFPVETTNGDLIFNIAGQETNGHFVALNSTFYNLHCYNTSFNYDNHEYTIRSRHFKEPVQNGCAFDTGTSFPSNTAEIFIHSSRGSPFDYVGIRFDEKTIIKSPSENHEIEAGDYIIIPYCLADIIFRKYKDAELDSDIRILGDIIAIATVGFTGGQSVGTRFLTYAEGAYGAVDLFVMAPDAYDFEVTGSSDIPQQIHNLWNNTGLVLSAPGTCQLFQTMGLGIRGVFLSKIKPTANYILTKSGPAGLDEFKQLLKETYNILKNAPANIDPANWGKMLNHLRAEIVALELNQVLAITSNFADKASLHVKKNLWATMFYLNTEYAIASGRYIDNLYYLKPLRFVDEVAHLNKVADDLENTRFLDLNDNPQIGKLEIYQDPENPSDFLFKKIPSTLLDGLEIRLGTPKYNKLQGWISRHWDEIGGDAEVQTLLNRLEITTTSDDPNKYFGFLDSFEEGDDAFRSWILGGQESERIDIWKNCSKDPDKAMDATWLKQLLASSGTSKIDNVNPVEINWQNNITGHSSTTNAVEFWNDMSKNYLYYTQGSYIFKYDFVTGTLLLGKTSTSKIVGFYEGAGNLTNFAYKNRPDELMAKLKRYQGMSGPSAPIINILFNPQIASTPGKTTTILGRLKHRPYLTGDMKAVVDELLSMVHTLDIDGKPGGFNVLNISDELYVGGTFWESYNLPWLSAAINRGDEIVAASNPMDLNNIFKSFEDIPVENLTTPESIATFLRGLDPVEASDIIENMTFYGREIKLLSENDYIFDMDLKKFMK